MNLWMSSIRNSHLEDCKVMEERQVMGSNWGESLFIRFGRGGWGLFWAGSLCQSSPPTAVPLPSTESGSVDQTADTMSWESCPEYTSLRNSGPPADSFLQQPKAGGRHKGKQALFNAGWTPEKAIIFSTVQEKVSWWPFMGVINANQPYELKTYHLHGHMWFRKWFTFSWQWKYITVLWFRSSKGFDKYQRQELTVTLKRESNWG